MRSRGRKWGLKGPVSGIMLIGLRVYQLSLSPVFYALGIRCRHEPTCSHYAMDAIRAQGPWRGGWLTLGRLGRCRPGGTFGVDPAPREQNEAPWWAVWRFRSKPGRMTDDRLPPADRADDKDM
ncbi:membrane protein insertion efficiency factor YidD [Maricaulis sp.]|uniref:membrane protein insertion efficiency factor YidD n=1 Tax=Maricaulis sp. TaxID=1486257 RepID=UPI003A8ED64B